MTGEKLAKERHATSADGGARAAADSCGDAVSFRKKVGEMGRAK
jgi:hypothetical protein